MARKSGRLRRSQGMVSLVGAGPGDPGLITVKGRDMLRKADAVVYDHLVSPRLLDECRPEAVRRYVGKDQHRHTLTQTGINRLLIRLARGGQCVVRLKGGDPVLFGRGGEEALALAKAGVPYEIVPGVTSAVAVPMYAGIPVTHRGMASSVAVVTGHEDPSKVDGTVRWDRLAIASETLVLLMGLSHLGEIARKLIRYGRSPKTPCAVIEHGTLPSQRTVAGTLATIARKCAEARVEPPAVIVIGEVVSLRRWLRWFEQRPLFGRRIVVTRAVDRADALANLLEQLGASVVRLPAIELVPVKGNGAFHRALEDIGRAEWVFFTSPEGIQWFQRLLAAEGKNLRVLQGRRIGAIGPKTAESIESCGLHVDFVPARFSQEGMLAGLRKMRLQGMRAVILSAEGSREVLATGLRRAGVRVKRIPVYRTVLPRALRKEVRALHRESVDWVTVTSASCADHFAQAMRASGAGRRISQLPFASIGPVSAAAVRQHGGRVAVEARSSTVEGLVEAIVASARRPVRRRPHKEARW